MSLVDLDNIQRLLNSFYSKIKKEFAPSNHGTHLSLGTTSSTAFRGDYGNTAYNHSQAAHAPSNAQKNSDITKAEIEAKLTGAITSHTHNAITSRGEVTCESGAAGRPAVSGLSMTQAYNNGYPTAYGNIINLRGVGDGQLLIGWSGSDGAHAPVYVRSKRDNTSTANWSDWAQIYTTANKPTASELGVLPLSGGTMTGPIKNGSMAGTWVDAANGGSIINSTRSAGGFHPLASGATTNGKMVLAMYEGSLQCTYLTKANCDTGANTVTRSTYLMDESGSMNVGGNLTTAGTLTVNGGHIHNISQLNFRAHADDSAYIKTIVDGDMTMLDFYIKDDAGSDRFRWTSSLWDSNSQSAVDRVAMELYPHINGSELWLHGALHNTGNLHMTSNGAAIYGRATDGGDRKILCLTGGNTTDVGNTSGGTCLLGSGSAHPTHYDGSNTYALHSDKNHPWGVFGTNGGQDFLGRGKRCMVATESELVINYGSDFTQTRFHGIAHFDGYVKINGMPVSVQSSAPGCGGVWIQI